MRTSTIFLVAALAVVVMTGAGCLPGTQANYTIALQRFSDPQTHITMANQYQTLAEQHTGWDVEVVHEADGSVVHWGRYGTLEKAGRGLAKVKGLKDPNGGPLFPWAMVIPMPGPAPGPPEWDLQNIQNPNAYYTVLVAEEYDIPERNYYGFKQRIVDYAQALRDKGYEAYYHVVGDKGYVCVGTFPRNAVDTIQQTVRHPTTGDRYQREMKVVRDPQMKKLLEVDFPDLQVVGGAEAQRAINPATRQIKMIKEPSRPYVIPGRDDTRRQP